MPQKKSLRLLMIEDDDAHAELIERSLGTWRTPVEIIRAADGRAALDLLSAELDKPHADRRLPGLILLDLKLPRVSGLTVLKKIKADRLLRQIPVITLTTSQADTDVRAAYESYVNSYVVKPIGYRRFCDAMNSIEAFWMRHNRLAPALRS